MATRSHDPVLPSAPRAGRGAAGALILLIALQGALYLRGLHPGVAEGDSAELQWASAIGGMAHSPGYAIQITVGRVFAALPFGPGIAWRINLMSAVFGVLGCAALFGAVRGITGRVLPAWVAATVMGCSSVYWSHAMIAEVYVFGTALLALACLAFVRFVVSGRDVWLAAAAGALGVTVAERPSEVLVVPAFLGAWIAWRGASAVTRRRAVLAAVCFVTPFLIALAINIMRSDASRLAVRDDALRDRIVGYDDLEVTFDHTRPAGAIPAVGAAWRFMIGERWGARVATPAARAQVVKLVWMLGGAGLLGDRFVPEGETDPMLAGGMAPGPLAMLLAAWGAWVWRRRGAGWVILGAGVVAGNLVFFLLYEAWDSLTFTCPAILGLSLLAGLGCAGPPGAAVRAGRTGRGARAGIGIAAALMLVPANLGPTDRNTPATRENLEFYARVEALPFPPYSVILTKYWPAMSLRYALWIEAGRGDISVIHTMRGSHLPIAAVLHNEGRPVYLTRNVLSEPVERELFARTPEPYRGIGFLSLETVPQIPMVPREGGTP